MGLTRLPTNLQFPCRVSEQGGLLKGSSLLAVDGLSVLGNRSNVQVFALSDRWFA
jgi:hypothetical protein